MDETTRCVILHTSIYLNFSIVFVNYVYKVADFVIYVIGRVSGEKEVEMRLFKRTI